MNRSFYGNSGRPQGTNWEEGINLIRAYKKEYQEYASVMTEYERLAAGREINRLKEQYRPMVTGHLLEELEASITVVKVREKARQKAVADEVNRWEAGRLAAEMQAAKMLISAANMAPKRDGFSGNSLTREERIDQLYQDAQNSGDIYKQRAMAAMLSEYNGDHELNHLVRQAEKDLQKLHITPEIEKATGEYEQAWRDLAQASHDSQTIAPEVGEDMGIFASGPVSQKLKQIDFVGRTILEADDPRIQNVIVKQSDSTFFAEG
jgi:hypothetical protein